MNKKLIGILVVIAAMIGLFFVSNKKEEDNVVIPEESVEQELTITDEYEEPEEEVVENTYEEENYEEEAISPKTDDRYTKSAVEKVEIVEKMKEEPVYEEEDFYYVVRPGDTLWSLSLEYYVDPYNYNNIASYNNIADPELIYPGKKIKFPGKIVKRDYIYTVALGDNLWNIAIRIYNNPHMWKFLAGYNGIDIEKRIIWPGMRLRIPYQTEKYVVGDNGESLWDICKAVYDNKHFAPRVARYNNHLDPYYVAPGTAIYYPVFKYVK